MRDVPASSRSAQAPPPLAIAVVLLLIAGACAHHPAVASDPAPRLRSGASPADSAAVLTVVGAALPSERARRVVDRFRCGARAPRCVELDGWSAWMPAMDPLLSELANAAGAELVRPDRTRIPPCPWNAGASEPVGYLAWLPHPILWGDSAVVRVRLSCQDALDSSNRFARREREYSLAREGASWRIVATSLTRSR